MNCKTDILNDFRRQLLQDVKHSHLANKFIRAIDLIVQENTNVQKRGQLAQFGLETSQEQKDDIDVVFRDIWERDVRAMKAYEDDGERKLDMHNAATARVTWNNDEMGELRLYISKLREAEEHFKISKKIYMVQDKEDEWETKLNDPVYVSKVKAAERVFAQEKKQKRCVQPEPEEEIPYSILSPKEHITERHWPSARTKQYSGYFHVCDIVNVDVTWNKIIETCVALSLENKVAVHFKLDPDTPDQEIYIDLELVDFAPIAIAIAKSFNYSLYSQYFFLHAPTLAVAHTSRHYVCQWPLRNGASPHRFEGYFSLEKATVSKVWHVLQTMLRCYKDVIMHVQKTNITRIVIFCAHSDFVKLINEIQANACFPREKMLYIPIN